MGFSGDCICVKNDFTFTRIDNIKPGDILYSPYDKNGTIVKEIKSNYSENGYKIKTQNFFEANIDENTLIQSCSIIIDKNSDKYFLSTPIFVSPKNMNKVSFILVPKLPIEKTNPFPNIYLYSKALLKGVNINDNLTLNKAKIKAKNIENNSSDIKKISSNIRQNTMNISFYELPFWIEDLNKKASTRFINEKIFNLEEQDFYNFIVGLLLENTDQFINLNNFRLYLQSKIMATQMLFLIPKYLNKVPNIEQIKKDIWSYEKIKQSSKKNIFAITCKDDLSKPLLVNNSYYQSLEYCEKNNRNMKYFTIITEDDTPFVVYNLITK